MNVVRNEASTRPRLGPNQRAKPRRKNSTLKQSYPSLREALENLLEDVSSDKTRAKPSSKIREENFHTKTILPWGSKRLHLRHCGCRPLPNLAAACALASRMRSCTIIQLTKLSGPHIGRRAGAALCYSHARGPRRALVVGIRWVRGQFFVRTTD